MKIEMKFTIEGSPRRQLVISADSVNEFSDAVWFRQFIGLTANAPEPVSRDSADADMMRVEIDQLRRQLESAKRQPQMQAPSRPAPVQSPPQESFMDVTPDRMTNAVWISLSPDQQAHYTKKYMG